MLITPQGSNKSFSFHTVTEETKPYAIKKQNGFIVFFKSWYFLILTLILISTVVSLTTTQFLLNIKESDGTFAELLDDNGNKKTATYTERPIYVESPVNGEFISQDNFNESQSKKVLAVMIENLAGIGGARPQAGLQDADIVYETIVEGDITRFMGIFWNKSSSSDPTTKLMPIRSSRKAFIDWLMEYNDPIYMHIGQADSLNPDTNALGALSKYNIKDISGTSNSFDRDHACEAKKPVEHCAWTDTKRLWSLGEKKQWTGLGNLETLQYKDDKVLDSNATTTNNANSVHIEFEDDPQDYSANWKYDPSTNTYLRSQGNTPHLDQTSGKQLFTKTLVIEKTSVQVATNDNPPGEPLKYHKIIKTIGTGDAWIIQDGKATLATWKKDSLTSRTRYFDKSTNKELSLDRGKMWITVTPNSPVIN